MKPYWDINNYISSFWKILLLFLLVTNPKILIAQRGEKTINTVLWDTQSPFVNTVDVRNKANWKVVPTNLLTLELNPSAAVADPAYYGREYSFKGDTVIENEHLIAVFFSKKGKLVIYKICKGIKTQDHHGWEIFQSMLYVLMVSVKDIK